MEVRSASATPNRDTVGGRLVMVQIASLVLVATIGLAGIFYATKSSGEITGDISGSRSALSQTAALKHAAWQQWDGTIRFDATGNRAAKSQRKRGIRQFEHAIREIRTTTQPGPAAELLAKIEADHERSVDRQSSIMRATARGSAPATSVAAGLRSHNRLLDGLERRATTAHAGLIAAEKRLADTRRNSLAGAIVALLAALALGYKLLRRSTTVLSSTLAHFVQAMRTLAAGRTDIKLDAGQMQGELANAAIAFNQVTDAMDQVQAKNRKQMEHLQQDARLDFLTGLPNRRYFTEELDRDIAQTRRYRYGAALSLVMLDLDHFKSVNDTYGHETGDEVLKAFAEVLKTCMRRSDFCARLGGEEFAVICPETDAPGAVKAAQKIRQAFAQTPLKGPDGPFFMTLSAGVAIHDVSQGATELIHAADTLLYVAKDKGRNQVCVQQTLHGERTVG